MNKKVAVAMSGGVDSSVTAALLKEQGYDVTGITMQVWPLDEFADEVSRFGGCCSLAAVEDARSVARKIGIDHYVLNFRKVFEKTVIDDFISEYQKGRTPNPCIRCNQHVKFKALLTKALGIDRDYLATGHYARVKYDNKLRRFNLLRGIDSDKDQSYVLYVLTQSQLEHLLLPLGEYKKNEIREIARDMDLPVAEKEESQEICFIPSRSYADYIAEKIPESVKPGDIVDSKGKVIGEHKGLIYYTCGQRKGLGITSDRPLYVIEIDKDNNRIVVGQEEELFGNSLIADEINLISVEKIEGKIKSDVQIRYNALAQKAKITMKNNIVKVVFDKPQKAITAGQAAVFYEEDKVIGGGTIESRT